MRLRLSVYLFLLTFSFSQKLCDLHIQWLQMWRDCLSSCLILGIVNAFMLTIHLKLSKLSKLSSCFLEGVKNKLEFLTCISNFMCISYISNILKLYVASRTLLHFWCSRIKAILFSTKTSHFETIYILRNKIFH